MPTKRKNKIQDENKITVVAITDEEEGMRSGSGALVKKLEIGVEQLSINVNVFLAQMGSIVANTPAQVGGFQLAEIEVSAEITGKGQVILWGVGGEVGTGGGIKFVFKKQVT